MNSWDSRCVHVYILCAANIFTTAVRATIQYVWILHTYKFQMQCKLDRNYIWNLIMKTLRQAHNNDLTLRRTFAEIKETRRNFVFVEKYNWKETRNGLAYINMLQLRKYCLKKALHVVHNIASLYLAHTYVRSFLIASRRAGPARSRDGQFSRAQSSVLIKRTRDGGKNPRRSVSRSARFKHTAGYDRTTSRNSYVRGLAATGPSLVGGRAVACILDKISAARLYIPLERYAHC